MLIIVLICIAIGVLVGFHIPFIVPLAFSKYLSVAILAGLDSLFGGIRAKLETQFDNFVLLTGFIANSLLAAGLAYMGDQLGVALYTAAVFVFGVRIFQNLAIIRRILLTTLPKKNPETPINSYGEL